MTTESSENPTVPVTSDTVNPEVDLSKLEDEKTPDSFINTLYKAIYPNDKVENGILVREVIPPDEVAARMITYLGQDQEQMKTRLTAYMIKHAERLASELPFMAPLNDYAKMFEDQERKEVFLREEGNKAEYWVLKTADYKEVDEILGPDILAFTFMNVSFNNAEDMEGVVFVNKRGKIRYSLVRRIGL